MIPRLLLSMIIPLSLQADIIDFETHPDGTNITNQYPGIIFTNATILTSGISLNEIDFPPHSGQNIIYDNGGPLTIAFSAPITTFSGFLTYLTPVVLNAYSTNNILLASVTTQFSNNAGMGGQPGSAPNEFISLAHATGIARIIISSDPAGSSFTLDDVTLNAVPEPSTRMVLLLLPLYAISRHLRRNNPPSEPPLVTAAWTSAFARPRKSGAQGQHLRKSPRGEVQ